MKILLLSLIMTLISVPALATTYYVRTDGNNSNTGTTDSAAGAWALPSKAATTMVCGDTTLVHAGTYTESGEILFSKTANCTPAKITLKNFTGESPKITWTAGAVSAGTARIGVRSSNPNTTPTPDVTVQGLELSGGLFAVKTEGSLRFTFTGNYVHDMNNLGILGSTNGGNLSMTVTNNLFLRIGDASGEHCLYVTGQDYFIANNLFIGCFQYGIQMDGGISTSGSPSASYAHFQGIIANNTFAYNVTGAGLVAWTGTGAGIIAGPVENTTIENNIFYENSQTTSADAQVIYSQSCSSCTVTLKNNLWFATGNSNTFSCVSGVGCAGAALPAGFVLQSNTNANPLFVNGPATIPASPDFHLTASSPAIGAGLDLSAILTSDYAGNPRSVPYDIGAYVFAVANDTTPPTAPVNITATATSSSTINLSWTASTDNVGVTAYLIERCQGVGCSSFFQIASISGITLSNSGLSPSTSYSYRVRATDAAGNLSNYAGSTVVAFLSHASASPATGLGASIPLTVSGANPAIVVGIGCKDSIATVSSVTWSLGSGTPLAVIAVRSGDALNSTWVIPSPTAGNGNVIVTLSASTPYQIDATVFTGVDQSNPSLIADAVSSTANTSPICLTPLNLTAVDAAYGAGVNTVSSTPTGVMPNGRAILTTSTVNMQTGDASGTTGTAFNYNFAGGNHSLTAIRLQSVSGVGTATAMTFAISDTIPPSAPTGLRVSQLTGVRP